MPDFIDYCGDRIPLHTGNSARGLYNMPDDQIDHFRNGTLFTEEGDLYQGEGFGTDYGDRMPLIDVKEARERAEFSEASGATLYQLAKRFEVPCKNQNGLPFCWGYGACTAYELNYLARYNRYVELSPDLTCAEATGGRSRGGWASEFFDVAEKRGIAPQSMVKRHDRNFRAYDTPEINAERAKYIPTDWLNFKRGDMAALRSALVSNIAGGMGLMWWGHLVAFAGWTWREKYGELWLYRNSHDKRFGKDGWAFCTTGPATHGGGSAVLVA